MNWRIVLYVVALGSVLLSGGTVAADGFSISSDDMVDVPDRQQAIPFGGGTDTVTHISRGEKNENITVTTVGPKQEYDVQLLNPTGGLEDKVTVSSGGEAKVELDSKTAVKYVGPGLYTIAIAADGEYQELHPVVIKEYDVSMSTSSAAVKKGSSVTATISIPEKVSETFQVEGVLTKQTDAGERERAVATAKSGEGTYTVSIPTSQLSEGEYEMSAVVVEEGEAYNGRYNIVGFSDLVNVTIDSEESPDSGDSTDGDSTGGGATAGGATESSSGDSQGNETGEESTGGSEANNPSPTPQDIKNTLQSVEPKRISTLGGKERSSGQHQEDSQTSSAGASSSVKAVKFSDGTQRVVSVADYGRPSVELEKTIVASITADNASSRSAIAETDGGVEPTSSNQTGRPQASTQELVRESRLNVVSLSNITVDGALNNETTAQVNLIVGKDAVSTPTELIVYKEEYSSATQEERWVGLEPTAVAVEGNTIEVTVQTNGFSLFAVTETVSSSDGQNQSENQSQNQSQDYNKTDDETETAESVPGFGWAQAVVALVIVSMVAARRVLSQTI